MLIFVASRTSKTKIAKMANKQKTIVALVAIIIAGGLIYFTVGRKAKVNQIKIDNQSGTPVSTEPANTEPVSPISGLSCENWNRRPIAVMQPADVPARPAAGFSDADMVIEMPVITATITRLMGVYICGNPDDVGSMRSARHDFVHLAKGLDAIFAHWGRSDMQWFKDLLNNGVIDNINCNDDAGKPGLSKGYCYRKEANGTMRGVDTGYAKFAKLLEGANDYGYRMESKFSGYPHQAEAAIDQRPSGGHLRVAYAGPFAAEYDYDRESNSYFRTWGKANDTDRNNGKRLAPKNIVVMMAVSEQIEGQYNNVQLGDPWMDTSDSGEAFYYMNGQQYHGTWKKDKSRVDSKLFLYDDAGKEIAFVPGQIWVEILEPGQALRWTQS
ncbi:MAG: hypothetical protein A3J63_03120 [Candidatus Moranbacteria bacterium RIFCSPHIGHO2_02_FULL_40_12b]|nr:MAG: hypothetical protein A3J63_03120 [Candidatus Moranbacteria bacterium RIFCSPHIGHO2_02_FULL_40_12b]